MKRSDVNRAIRETLAFIVASGYQAVLPVKATFNLADWYNLHFHDTANHDEMGHIVQANLGWDVTNFGFGDFNNWGRVLYTLENRSKDYYPDQTFSLKLLNSRPGQKAPMHYHEFKREVIKVLVGQVIMDLCKITGEGRGEGQLDRYSDNWIRRNDERVMIPADTEVVLNPQETLYLQREHGHSFWGGDDPEMGTLSLEKATVNDDVGRQSF